jgi:hypothetical protein
MRSLLLVCHRSTLSKKMASGEPGAVHRFDISVFGDSGSKPEISASLVPL